MVPRAKRVVFFFPIKKKSQTEAPELPPPQDIHSPHAHGHEGGHQGSRLVHGSLVAAASFLLLLYSRQCLPSQHHHGSAWPHCWVGFAPFPLLFSVGHAVRVQPPGGRIDTADLKVTGLPMELMALGHSPLETGEVSDDL